MYIRHNKAYEWRCIEVKKHLPLAKARSAVLLLRYFATYSLQDISLRIDSTMSRKYEKKTAGAYPRRPTHRKNSPKATARPHRAGSSPADRGLLHA